MYNCPTCGEPFELGTRFCPKCGCNLEESFIENPVCPVCMKSYPAGTAYCATDGAKLVSPDKLIPKCVICGTQYPANTKFCPKDGGAIIPEAFRNKTGGTAQGNAIRYQKADLGKRFVATLLDGLICAGLSIPSIALFITGLSISSRSYHCSAGCVFIIILSVIASLIPIVYLFIKDGLGKGQSWGKKAMKIKVINIADSSKCTKGASALRTLIGYLLNCIPFVGGLIEPIMVLAKDDGRRLADMAAGTMVVNV